MPTPWSRMRSPLSSAKERQVAFTDTITPLRSSSAMPDGSASRTAACTSFWRRRTSSSRGTTFGGTPPGCAAGAWNPSLPSTCTATAPPALLDQLVPDGIAREAGHVADAKAVHDAQPVHVHRLRAQAQLGADLARGEALGHQREDLDLACRQLLVRPHRLRHHQRPADG